MSFERGSSFERDESFDADLENAEKTPVVLPEDWSRMSPDEARTDLTNAGDDVFDAVSSQEEEEDEEEATSQPHPSTDTRIPSDTSDSTRPLPPLPAFLRQTRRGSDTLSTAAERAAAQAPRTLPSPPKRASCSKEDILAITANRSSALGLGERLLLLGPAKAAHEERPSSKSSHDTLTTRREVEEEVTITNLDARERGGVHVAETEVRADDSSLGNTDVDFDTALLHAPPRISRESILRTVRGAKHSAAFEDEDEEDENAEPSEFDARPSIAELARMHPEQAVPSRENSRDLYQDQDEQDEFQDAQIATAYVEEFEEGEEGEVKIKIEPVEHGEGEWDMSSIPERSGDALECEDVRLSSVLRQVRRELSEDGEDEEEDEDSVSRYSSVEEPDAESTMVYTQTHTQTLQTQTLQTREVEHEDGEGKETLQEAMQLLTVKDYSSSKEVVEEEKEAEPTKQGRASFLMTLPAALYLGTDEDYDFGMKQYITPSPPAAAAGMDEKKRLDATTMVPELLPSSDLREPPSHAAVSPPGTPESVIHHDDDDGEVSPIEEQPAPRAIQVIPERIASIKTGGKLKARPSATPADFETMAERRRIVSTEFPVPAIPLAYRAEVANPADAGAEDDASVYEQEVEHAQVEEKTPARRKSRKSGGVMDHLLDSSAFSLGEIEVDGEGDGTLGLDREFERVIEGQKVGFPQFSPLMFGGGAGAQYGYIHDAPSPYVPHTRSAGVDVDADGYARTQKGYLMRQNTKVVVASNRTVSGGSNETAKSSSTAGEARPVSKGAKGRDGGRKPSEEQFFQDGAVEWQDETEECAECECAADYV